MTWDVWCNDDVCYKDNKDDMLVVKMMFIANTIKGYKNYVCCKDNIDDM